MAVKFKKPEINIREKLAELDKSSGIAGEAVLRAETPQEQFNLIGAGRKNMIINGDMRIDQRNSGTAISALTGNNEFPLDRWFINQAGVYSSASLVTAGQNLDSLTPPAGFDKYIGVKIINATAADANPFLSIRQIIEGHNIAHLDYGKSTAKDITISFWARTNHPGVYALTLRGGTTQTAYVTEFSIDAANTWQYISLVIPGQSNTATTWSNAATEGLVVNIGLGSFQGTYASNTLNKWVTGGFTGSTTQHQKFAQTNGNAFYVTGFQLEAGNVSTPFEHRSHGEELALCQRYFTVMPNGIFGISSSSSTFVYSYQLPVQMRAAPTVSLTSTNQRQGDTVAQGISVTSASVSNNLYTTNAVAVFIITGTLSAAATPYRMYLYEATSAFPAKVHLKAEL